MEDEIVYIPEFDVYGEIIYRGAYASTVRYRDGGILYEVIMLNEDFEEVEE